MYDQFSERAKTVIRMAQDEAKRLNHAYIGTEHLLLGLAKEGTGVASVVIKNLGVDLRKIPLEIEKYVASGTDPITTGHLPMTPKAKSVIDHAMQEATSLGHGYVGTEHLLLGMFGEREGLAAQILMNFGLEREAIRTEIQKLLALPTDLPDISQLKTPFTLKNRMDSNGDHSGRGRPFYATREPKMRSKLGWGAAIVLCVLIQGVIFGIGLIIGAIIGENGSAHRRYQSEEGIITPIIQADPAFTEIEVMQGCDGSLYLGGEVQTPADLDRLKSQVIRAVGEPRSVEVMSPVQVKK